MKCSIEDSSIERMYVFGSILHADNPRDIDILAVLKDSWRENKSITRKAIKAIEDSAKDTTGYRVHLTILTEKEITETDILNRTRFQQIFQKQQSGNLDRINLPANNGINLTNPLSRPLRGMF